MKKPLTLAVLLISFNAAASNVCAIFDDAIETSLKNVAMEVTGGVLDNSAPRESNRLAKINNEYTLIGLNLKLMQQNKCPPYKKRLHEGFYFADAISCQSARMASKDGIQSPACELKKWERGSYTGK